MKLSFFTGVLTIPTIFKYSRFELGPIKMLKFNLELQFKQESDDTNKLICKILNNKLAERKNWIERKKKNSGI